MDRLRTYTAAMRGRLERAGLDPSETTLRVRPDGTGRLHHETRKHACQIRPTRSANVPLETDAPGCEDCHWTEVPCTQAGLYWASVEKLAAAEEATVRLRSMRGHPVETLEGCEELAAALDGVPRAAPEHEEAADRIAAALDGPLRTEYLGRLAARALEDLQEQVRALRRQGLTETAEVVAAALETAVGEMVRPGCVLVSVGNGWSRNEMLTLAARNWRVDGSLYLIPREVYAYRRGPGGEAVRDAVLLERAPVREVLETTAVLYDPDGDGPYRRLRPALEAAEEVNVTRSGRSGTDCRTATGRDGGTVQL